MVHPLACMTTLMRSIDRETWWWWHASSWQEEDGCPWWNGLTVTALRFSLRTWVTPQTCTRISNGSFYRLTLQPMVCRWSVLSKCPMWCANRLLTTLFQYYLNTGQRTFRIMSLRSWRQQSQYCVSIHKPTVVLIIKSIYILFTLYIIVNIVWWQKGRLRRRQIFRNQIL